MGYMHPDVLDAALNVFVNASPKALHICSAQPLDYNDVSSVSLGYKINPTINAPQDYTPNGRKVQVAEFSDGTVTATGTATHWAITDGTRLLAANELGATKSVTSGQQFPMSLFEIVLPGAI